MESQFTLCFLAGVKGVKGVKGLPHAPRFIGGGESSTVCSGPVATPYRSFTFLYPLNIIRTYFMLYCYHSNNILI